MSAEQRIRRGRLRWLRPAVVFLLAALVTLGAKTFAGTAPDDDVPVVTDWEAFRAEKQREHAYSSKAIDESNATMYKSKKLLHELFPDEYPPPGEYPQPDVYEPTEGEIRFFEKYGGGNARTPTKAARIIYPHTAIRLALLTAIGLFLLLALRLKKSRKEFAKMVRLSQQTVQVRARCDELDGQVVVLKEQANADRSRLKKATEEAATAEEALQKTHELEVMRLKTELECNREKLETAENERKYASSEAMVAIRAKVKTHELEVMRLKTELECNRGKLETAENERKYASSEAMVAIRAERRSEKADELARQVARLTEQANAGRGSLEEAAEKAARAEEALQHAQESLKTLDQQAKRMEVVLGEERAKLAKEVQTKEKLKNLLGKETASKIAILNNREAGLKSARTELEKVRRDNLSLVEEMKKHADAERVAVNQARKMARAQHQRELEEQRTKLVKLSADLEERDRLLLVEKRTKEKLEELLKASSKREAQVAKNVPANASLTKRVQVLEVELAGARDDLQSAEDAQRAAVCAESVAVDSAEALKTKLRWANEAIRGLKDERAKAKEREEGKGCVEDSPLRVKFLEAELAKVSEDLQWAEHVQQAAACAESAAVHKAKALETKLGLANEAIEELKAGRAKAKESEEGKGRVRDSPAKDAEPAPYFCCVAGCTVSRRGRYFHHGSGPGQLICCPDCYVGLKGGKVVVFPGRLVLKAHMNRHDGDQDAESALSWRRETVPDCTGLHNPKNWCGLICIVQTLLKWDYFEHEAIMATREEEAKKGAPGPAQAQSKLAEAGPPQSGEKSKALLSLLGVLLTSMRSAKQGAATYIPDAIVTKLGIKALVKHQQTDAAEILGKFLEITAGETGATQNGIGIGNKVEGKTRTKFQCDCGRVSEPPDAAFTVLSVPVSPLPASSGKSKKKGQQRQGGGGSAARRSLVDLLVEYFGKSPVDGPCDVCKDGIAKTNKRTSTDTLTKAPSKLFIQLNRVNYDRYTYHARKVTDKVDIPLVLDLSPFMPGGKGNAVYDVDTTVHHLGGTAASGHYTAYARVEGQVWCHFDDHQTTTVGTDQALAEGVYLVSYTKRP